MPDFIPGLELGRLFYLRTVKPLLQKKLPDLKYSAALIGSGSEIFGFDTEMSVDHHWGPRVMLFLKEEDQQRYSQVIGETLRSGLPTKFHGYSTNFSPPDPLDNNVQRLEDIEIGPVNHRVEVLSTRRFLLDYLGFDIGVDIDQPVEAADWLTFPAQKLRSLIAGAVYHDDIGLQSLRNRFSYYPRDVWLYLLASGWNRIGQEEHLMGRAGFTLLYFGTGLAGNLLSLAIHPQLVAAGASGAVFGITAGLVAYLALKKAPLGFESIKKELKSLAIFIGYNLIYSFRPGVDGMAHIGGLASGLVIAAALPRFLETPGVQPVTSPIQEKSSVNSRIAKIGIACAVAFLLAAVGIRRMQSDSIYVLTSLNRIDAGQSADVIPTLEKIVGRQPNSALAHFALGAAYIRVNRGTDAVRELNLANSSQPGNSGFQQELGAAYLLQSDFANALTILQQCLTQDPANSHARIGLAAALLGTAQYQQAADEARKVISELPNEAEPHDLLGQAEIQLGAIPDGLHELETALQINPKDADLRSRLLAEYQATGRASQYRDLAAQSSSSDKVSGSTPMKTPTTH